MDDCGCKNKTVKNLPVSGCNNPTSQKINAVGSRPGYAGHCHTCNSDISICGCKKSLPKPGCPANHLPNQIHYNYSPNIKSAGRAMMPNIDMENDILFPSVDNLEIGAVIFSNDVGFLEIMAFDPETKMATVRNSERFVGYQVLDEGDWIQDCTNWAYGPLTPGGSGTAPTDGCWLEKDFTVPAVGFNAVANFTSTDCFSNNQFIRIDGTPLKVIDVISSLQAELQNVDASTDANKVITAKDCDRLLHKVILIGEVPECENEVEVLAGLSGVTDLDTCERGVLSTDLPNQFPVSNENGDFVLQTLPFSTVEIPVLNCLTLIPGTTEYPILLETTEGLEVGKVVTFTCDEDERTFNIKSLDVGENTIVIVPCFPITQTEAIAENCADCSLRLADCCDQCNGELVGVASQLGATQALAFGETIAPVQFYGPNLFPVVGGERIPINQTFTNNTCCTQVVEISSHLDIISVLLRGTTDRDAVDGEGRDLSWLLELKVSVLHSDSSQGLLAHFAQVYDSEVDIRDQASGKRRMFISNSGAPAESYLSTYSFLNRTGTYSRTTTFELAPGESAQVFSQDLLALSDNYGTFDWGLQSNIAKTSLEISMTYGISARVFTKAF